MLARAEVSINPRCPLHVGTTMIRQEVRKSLPHRPMPQCVQRYFRCPIVGCSRVETDLTFYTTKTWAGDCLEDD